MFSDLERLQRKKRGTGRLDPADTRGALPASSGIGYPGASSETGGGTGALASPLTETGRTLHPPHTVTSSDGLFSLEFYPVNTITFEDTNAAEVQFVLAEPV